ncbi:MAG: hypothetical protein HC778_05275 [Chamaesiphon sp. CSU_1_12]|nr:hypothetical protein [Chamaesiphon sp. CSU_1_12]
MNFQSKLTLALVASSAVFPMAAQALPTTGTTAAAVSIKFDGTSNGNFQIQPGTNATGGGTGVRELSAAVATGETESTASSASLTSGPNAGTTATARGFSTPVTFSYVSTSDIVRTNNTSDSVNFSTSQENRSNVQATTTKNSNFDNYREITASDDKTATNNLTDNKTGVVNATR